MNAGGDFPQPSVRNSSGQIGLNNKNQQEILMV